MITPNGNLQPLLNQLTERNSTPQVPDRIREAADGFESLFVTQLLEPLEKSAESLFGTGPEGRTIGGLFREELAKSVAATRPLGVAELIERELIAREAGTSAAAAALNPSQAIARYRKAQS